MKIDWLSGCATALVTPFRADSSLDEECFRRLVERQLAAGIKVLVPCGTTGENVTMSEAERLRVIEWTVEIAGAHGAFVVAGTGGNDTSATVEFTRQARDLGIDAALVVAPYYNKPTPEGLFQHYKTIAEATPELPLVLYNVPGRTASNISADTTSRLARECENIVAIKDASGDWPQVMAVLKHRPPHFAVFTGDDAAALPLIALGGEGVISVASNAIPELMSQLINAALAGDFQQAREIHYRILPLLEGNFIESNPAPVKFVMQEMGLLEESLRLPLVPVTEQSREVLREVTRLVLG